jgi:hypothetical protein
MLFGTLCTSTFFLPILPLPTFSSLPTAAELLSNSVGVVLPEETDEDLWFEVAAPALKSKILKEAPYHYLKLMTFIGLLTIN